MNFRFSKAKLNERSLLNYFFIVLPLSFVTYCSCYVQGVPASLERANWAEQP